MDQPILMRKHLDTILPTPTLPAGTQFADLSVVGPEKLHGILADAYATGFGSIAPFNEWWPSLTGDSEFDPSLVFIVTDRDGTPVGVAQCWTTGFVKDLAVLPAWRTKGVGEALLTAAFHSFLRMGLAHVDLKVVASNAAARHLYHRMGMIEVPR